MRQYRNPFFLTGFILLVVGSAFGILTLLNPLIGGVKFLDDGTYSFIIPYSKIDLVWVAITIISVTGALMALNLLLLIFSAIHLSKRSNYCSMGFLVFAFIVSIINLNIIAIAGAVLLAVARSRVNANYRMPQNDFYNYNYGPDQNYYPPSRDGNNLQSEQDLHGQTKKGPYQGYPQPPINQQQGPYNQQPRGPQQPPYNQPPRKFQQGPYNQQQRGPQQGPYQGFNNQQLRRSEQPPYNQAPRRLQQDPNNFRPREMQQGNYNQQSRGPQQRVYNQQQRPQQEPYDQTGNDPQGYGQQDNNNPNTKSY